MDTSDEIPLEDHRYFSARLDHLEHQHPVELMHHLENGTLTTHLRELTGRALQARAHLVITSRLPPDVAEELVMNQIVADPLERSELYIPASRTKLRKLVERYRRLLADLPRTYPSETEITK